VLMRLIRMLREKNITLIKAVEAVRSLRERFGPPGKRWADARIFAQNRDVFVYSADEWETTVATRHGQKAADFLFGAEFALLRDRADALLIPRNYMQYVEIDPIIRNGLPIVLDTSVLTSVIHGLRQKGDTYDRIQSMYPFILRKTIIGTEKYERFLDAVGNAG